MSGENLYQDEIDAAELVRGMLARPIGIGSECFDPWEFFGLYGSYSSDFDQCAIDVLSELLAGKKIRKDLGAEMFREMLCNKGLCDYGTSPRTCFATPFFQPLLEPIIQKWRQHSLAQWESVEG